MKLEDLDLNKEIADKISLSTDTIRTHLKHIYEKMHVRSRTEAVVRYMSLKSPIPGRDEDTSYHSFEWCPVILLGDRRYSRASDTLDISDTPCFDFEVDEKASEEKMLKILKATR